MIWEYNDQDIENIKKISKEYKIPQHITKILLKRGIDTLEKINDFLYPNIDKLEDPYCFENMEKVVERILLSKEKNEKIFIYGDYDVDGITATAFLVIALKNVGINIDYYIPNRFEEGYGLSKKAIDAIKNKGGNLIITVDVGVNSINEIKYANEMGIDIIITDHHKAVEEEEKQNVLTINPKLSDNYKFKDLSGAGVALKLAKAYYIKENHDIERIYDYLDIVMIGTVADVVTMVDENRTIIKEGLKTFKNTKIKGLEFLAKYLKLENKDLTTTDISFFISPMLNALGRLGDSNIGVDFFISKDEKSIFNIIEEMKKANKERRVLEKLIYDEAMDMLDNVSDKNYIFLKSEKWHSGVIGVVASRLTGKYNKPTILLSTKDGIAKASCRSIDGISIFNILKKIPECFIRFGGHDLAVGFMAKEENLDKIETTIKDNLIITGVSKERKKIQIDLKMELEHLTDSFLSDIKRLAPFGVGNPQPLVITENVYFKSTKKFGIENRHFKTFIKKNNKSYSAVAFNLGYKFEKLLSEAQRFDIVYYPEKINYNGDEILQLKIKDFKPVEDFEDIFI
ncbi:MAG: single-stranded-DNA-specific exonuclease RecJ [Fusobacteria bacterium]|nr:single-stranded-DNA-specific exonuclease RecJ [Fusobacteriota bacterium]